MGQLLRLFSHLCFPSPYEKLLENLRGRGLEGKRGLSISSPIGQKGKIAKYGVLSKFMSQKVSFIMSSKGNGIECNRMIIKELNVFK